MAKRNSVVSRQTREKAVTGAFAAPAPITPAPTAIPENIAKAEEEATRAARFMSTPKNIQAKLVEQFGIAPDHAMKIAEWAKANQKLKKQKKPLLPPPAAPVAEAPAAPAPKVEPPLAEDFFKVAPLPEAPPEKLVFPNAPIQREGGAGVKSMNMFDQMNSQGNINDLIDNEAGDSRIVRYETPEGPEESTVAQAKARLKVLENEGARSMGEDDNETQMLRAAEIRAIRMALERAGPKYSAMEGRGRTTKEAWMKDVAGLIKASKIPFAEIAATVQTLAKAFGKSIKLYTDPEIYAKLPGAVGTNGMFVPATGEIAVLYHGDGTLARAMHELMHSVFHDLPEAEQKAIRTLVAKNLTNNNLKDIAHDWGLSPLYEKGPGKPGHLETTLEEALSIATGQLVYERPDFMRSLAKTDEEKSLLRRVYDYISDRIASFIKELGYLPKPMGRRAKLLSIAESILQAKKDQIDAAREALAPATTTTAGVQKSVMGQTASDREYFAAVESGDKATQRRIVEEAAEAAGYDWRLWHGSTSKENFYVFDEELAGSSFQKGFGGFHFTESKEVAENYAGGRKVGKGDIWSPAEGEGRIGMFYLRLKNPKEYGPNARGVEVGAAEQIKLAKAEGHDSLILLGRVWDPSGVNRVTFANDQVVVFSPSQIKSADLITRDEQGNIIPPSQRFNEKNPELRHVPGYRNFLARLRRKPGNGNAAG
jgi:hypothetical protein